MPWNKVVYESALKIAMDQSPAPPCYGVIMGASGMTFGLSLYDDLRFLRLMLSGRMSEHEAGRRTVATTVVFGSEAEIPMPDLEAARRHEWEVAGPRAYPWFFRKEGNRDPHSPSAAQIELLTACLRAVPEFVSRRGQHDATLEEIAVSTSTGETRLTMSWIVE